MTEHLKHLNELLGERVGKVCVRKRTGGEAKQLKARKRMQPAVFVMLV